MPPLNDRDRITFGAIGLLETGLSPQRATERLQQRYPFLTPEEAAAHVSQAQVAQANVIGASFAGEGETVGGAAGRPEEPNRQYTVEYVVLIDAPGRDREYRTVRLRASGAETIESLNEIVQQQVDEWDEVYDVDGRSSVAQMRYIL